MFIFVINSRYWGWRFVSIFNWTCRFVISSDRAGWLVSMACGVNFYLLSNEVMILRRWVIQYGINVGLFRIWSFLRFNSHVFISRFIQPSLLAGSGFGAEKNKHEDQYSISK